MTVEKKIDRFGWEYYDQVPEDFKQACLDDFHHMGRLLIGQEFIIKYADTQKFQVCYISERLTGRFLLPFIQANRVFIKTEKQCQNL